MYKSTLIRVLALSAIIPAAALGHAQNLVQNANFGTGDLTDWTNGGDGQAFVVTSPVHLTDVYSAKLTPGTSDNTLFQTVTTVAGADYNFSFWLINTAVDPFDFYQAHWDGAVIDSGSLRTTNSWTEFSYTVQATSTSTQIGIEAHNSTGNYYLDDVSVVQAVPEPSSMAFLSLGAVGVLARLKRKR